MGVTARPCLPCADRRLGRRICEALGLDPDTTGRVRLDIEPGRPVMVVAEHYVTTTQLDGLLELVQEYRLVEVPK